MTKGKDMHLWWLWSDPQEGGIAPEEALRQASPDQLSACGRRFPNDEITTDLKQITCVHCKIKASQQAA